MISVPRKNVIKRKSDDPRVCLYMRPKHRELLSLMIEAGFYKNTSDFLAKKIEGDALKFLPRVKTEIIEEQKARLMALEKVSTEWDRIETEQLARKEKLAEIWQDILVSFKRIYKAPGKYDSAHDLAQNRIQGQNWLESRYLDDPETREAVYEMFGTVDKGRLFELAVEGLTTIPNFER